MMDAAATVVTCALSLLGLSTDSFPPITILNSRPPMMSPDGDAFTAPAVDGVRTIYAAASAPAFAAAMQSMQVRGGCGNREPMQMVAGILAHEAWHVEHGSDEHGAYEAQLRALLLIGSGPSRWPYRVARRSMITALARQKMQRLPAQGAVAGQ